MNLDEAIPDEPPHLDQCCLQFSFFALLVVLCEAVLTVFLDCIRVSHVMQGPVIQSIVSLTSSLRGHLFKYFMTL